MNITISTTAVQRGKGTDKYKSVSFLTENERQIARDGGIVAFQSEYISGGNHGTYWRVVKYDSYFNRFSPRVPDEETLNTLEEEHHV